MSKTFVTVRITPKDRPEVYENIMNVVRGKFGGGYVCVREHSEEENEHYHVHMMPSGTVSQFREALKRATKGVADGNKYKSIKVCDLKFLQYVCKGDSSHPMPRGSYPDVVEKHGLFYTDERIRDAHDAYWKESVAIKTERDVSFATQVENHMKINRIAFTPENVSDVMITLCLESKGKKLLNEFYLRSVGKYVLSKNDRGYRAALKERLTRDLELV